MKSTIVFFSRIDGSPNVPRLYLSKQEVWTPEALAEWEPIVETYSF